MPLPTIMSIARCPLCRTLPQREKRFSLGGGYGYFSCGQEVVLAMVNEYEDEILNGDSEKLGKNSRG